MTLQRCRLKGWTSALAMAALQASCGLTMSYNRDPYPTTGFRAPQMHARGVFPSLQIRHNSTAMVFR